MANTITKEQYEKLEMAHLVDNDEYNALLFEYLDIVARPYTAFQYFDPCGDYICDSNDLSLDQILAYVSVKVEDE